ncbi:hypothetical protein CIW49_26890 [Mycolicibacterium sp. P1-18]|uniref:hypothetical protein n=1 Tax=Mycolicibacterium sp. P1-18 TaxID=2024615 RepID=UPI0011F3C063|nr:hypothetical protein [Mycolicibacterium sp. P1-18]KAA0093674.1 hypothetical protein CIW49_26890 [Mycolicibacterium sp. P1-18]
MIGRWHYWLLTHPRTGRPVTVLATTWAMAVMATTVAPQASAASNAMLLNWTGLRDTYGVAPGDYVFAMASVRDQILAAGPGVSLDPATWMQWMGHTLAVLLANVTAANILTAEAGFFCGTVTLALWLFRLTVSTYWLTVVGEIARAITAGVVQVTTRLGLIAVAVPIGVFVGVLTLRRGERGRGWTMILVAVTMPALSVAVFSDPASQMYGPDGVLAFGRRVGFSVAEAATHNGAVGGGGGFDGQVDALTASLLTHTVREPLQLWNFGHVVDHVGGCGAAWSAAVRHGDQDGPVAAMRACGDRAAVAYVQHLDGSNVWTGLVLVVCSLLLGLFMVASGWAVLKVSVAAVWTTVKLLPALWIGGIPGAPQRHAVAVVWQFFRHGIEVLVYVVFVSVIGLAIERLVAAPLPAELGGDNPFAHVLMMGACCVAAFALLAHVRRDLAGGGPAPRGLLGRGADVAVGMGMQAAIGGVAGAAIGGAKALRGRGGQQSTAPWEQLEGGARDGSEVLGAPRPGFTPVPGSLDGGGHLAGGGYESPVSGSRSPGFAAGGASDQSTVTSSGASRGTGGVAPISAPATEPSAATQGRRSEPGGRGVVEVTERLGEEQPSASGEPIREATSVAPVTSLPSTGYGEDIPPNLDPPEDEWPPSSGDDPRGVDPIV